MGCVALIRGVIEHDARSRQINDFSGLLYGNITPTDIDGLIEYRNKAYVIFEVKYGAKDVPYGQKLAIERLVNDTSNMGKQSIALIIEHNVDDASKQIPVAECNVRELYYCRERKWRTPKQTTTAKQAIDGFLSSLH